MGMYAWVEVRVSDGYLTLGGFKHVSAIRCGGSAEAEAPLEYGVVPDYRFFFCTAFDTVAWTMELLCAIIDINY